MTCKQCKNYDECQFDAACNDAVFDPECSAKHCTGFELLTNADRIRAMSDEELESFLVDVDLDKAGSPFITEWGKWLKQPAEENGNT